MKKYLVLIVMALAIVIVSCEKTEEISVVNPDQVEFITHSEVVIPGQYIVLLESSNLKSAYKTKVEADHAVALKAIKISNAAQINIGEPKMVYSQTIEGVVVNISEEEANTLMSADGVHGVYPDKMVTLKKPGTDPDDLPEEVVPYGIIRVGGGATYSGTHKAWIIDTGIDMDHPDLNVDQTLGATFITRTTTPEDDNGHGSHCAGIVAAIDNEIGVVGVAAGATVVPVKVLDKRGSGAYSVIIAGVDYVAANAETGDAANMSLGGGVYEPIDDAVIALGEAGVMVALAAGNESDDANNHSPARANGTNIYTVSAMDVNDEFAYFSNYGNPPIDYCAPGVSILSCYKSGGFATMSGTSMAAPHVCGLLLATDGDLTTDGYVIGDPDGDSDPIAHM
ncbi:S8 family serine peptidase [Draconibacterium sp. IB214405]|uniref:S8 family peptidase n=1 Tax=Draconibacterium sp. IB214405 TaxID=3097352 RepID=UPI002A0E4840|nr:S8 family serine peptidase [Draconibacterium sp. IB214405]MDX8339716.1 S8 family serine peptidase [Draconibacterium sp. IB214405]